MEFDKVVVHYSNGRVVKGFTQDFFSDKDCFHIFTSDAFSGPSIEVSMKELKAVFFVRDLIGDPNYNERKEYAEGKDLSGWKVEVIFMDGEVLVGSTLVKDQKQQGFFVFPADPKSNNIKVFVVSSAVKYFGFP